MPRLTIRLNGQQVTADYQAIGAGTSQVSEDLLYWLRERFGQHGPRFGCGVAQCGACTVLLNGVPTRSCVLQAHTVPALADVRTLDGLASDGPHPLQQAFVEQQAGQCAFCVNGMVMGSLGWLEGRIAAGNREVPSTDEIKDFLSGASPVSGQNYICRCGTHARIVAAIQRAAEVMVR
jgi:aerobic-type carbon monoxide dehydrogenase small subunit (CoxS/CutS family)